MPVQSRYNAVRYNEARYNGGPAFETFSTDLFVFDGFSLHNNSTIFISRLNDSGPTRALLGGEVPRADGEFLNADYWRKKRITIEGTITAASATALETLMDTIRKNLRNPEANLDITRNGVVRRYIATLVNMENLFPDRQHFHTTWIPFSATFECRTPFAQDRGYSSISEQVTSSPHSLTGVENVGTIEAQPVIVFVVDAANTGTVFNIKRIDSDANTLDEIEYSGTFAAGDVFEFDSENKTVKKNGTEVDYTGSFPVLDVGFNTFSITTTASSFDMLATVKWKNRYL